MELTGTHLRYLMTIYRLYMDSGEVRMTEIANAIHVKKSSVARIITIFREENILKQEHYGKVGLTEYGMQLAEKYYAAVQNVAVCLQESGLQLEEEEAFDIACLMLPELPKRCLENNLKKVIDN